MSYIIKEETESQVFDIRIQLLGKSNQPGTIIKVEWDDCDGLKLIDVESLGELIVKYAMRIKFVAGKGIYIER